MIKMIIKNEWDSFKIKNIVVEFNSETYLHTVTFDFDVIKSYEWLPKKHFTGVELNLGNNLPLSMVLDLMFQECVKIIDNAEIR